MYFSATRLLSRKTDFRDVAWGSWELSSPPLQSLRPASSIRNTSVLITQDIYVIPFGFFYPVWLNTGFSTRCSPCSHQHWWAVRSEHSSVGFSYAPHFNNQVTYESVLRWSGPGGCRTVSPVWWKLHSSLQRKKTSSCMSCIYFRCMMIQSKSSTGYMVDDVGVSDIITYKGKLKMYLKLVKSLPALAVRPTLWM